MTELFPRKIGWAAVSCATHAHAAAWTLELSMPQLLFWIVWYNFLSFTACPVVWIPLTKFLDRKKYLAWISWISENQQHVATAVTVVCCMCKSMVNHKQQSFTKTFLSSSECYKSSNLLLCISLSEHALEFFVRTQFFFCLSV